MDKKDGKTSNPWDMYTQMKSGFEDPESYSSLAVDLPSDEYTENSESKPSRRFQPGLNSISKSKSSQSSRSRILDGLKRDAVSKDIEHGRCAFSA